MTIEALVSQYGKMLADAGVGIDRARVRDIAARLHAGDGAAAPSRRELLQRLCEAAGDARLAWLDGPDAGHLPLLTHHPRWGWSRIVARSAAGGWQLEAADGSRQSCDDLDGLLAARLVPGERRVRPGRVARDLFRAAFARHKRAYFECGLATLVTSALALGTSFYSMQVYDRVIPSQGYATLVALTVGALLAVVLELVTKLSRARVLDSSIELVDAELAREVFSRYLRIRIDRLPPSVGTLAAQLRGLETVRGFFSSTTLFAMVDAPLALFYLFVMWAMGGGLVASVPAAFLVIALAIGLATKRAIERHALAGAGAANRKIGLLVESVEGNESVKATGSGWKFLSKWMDLSERGMRHEMDVRHIGERTAHWTQALQQLAYVLMVAAGAWEITQGRMTTGALIACSILSGRLMAPVGMIPSVLTQWAHARAALDGLEKVLSLETDNHGVERPLAPPAIAPAYALKDVSFRYERDGRPLAVPALEIPAGQKVGIVGPAGSGKSTLLRLLAGLYRPQEGSVRLGGFDLPQLARERLVECVGYLPQDVRLFAGTLRDNLVIGLADPGDERVLQACAATGLSAIVQSHPKGLELPIAEGGGGVSGGQRQLIGLTRLLIADPGVWLLDEPTAAMDEALESRCIQVLRDRARPQDTLVLVTHRLTLLQLVDRLIVMGPEGVMLDGPRNAVLQQLQASQRPAAVKPVTAATS
jgi:ATP-binding cassette subfamily C protein LapB